MLHLALVQNLLTAVGARPPPRPAELPDAAVQLPRRRSGSSCCRSAKTRSAISPSSSDRRAWISRTPRGSRRSRRPWPLPHDERTRSCPHLQDFDTIGHLYRSIQAGLEHLAERLGHGTPVHRAAGCPGDGGAFPVAGARRGHRPGIGACGRSTRSSSRARERAASGATPISGGSWASSTSTSRQASGPDLRARPAGHRGERPAAGDRRGRAAHHRSGHDPLHGPPQRRLRGPAPAPVALLRPHR